MYDQHHNHHLYTLYRMMLLEESQQSTMLDQHYWDACVIEECKEYLSSNTVNKQS